jgi:5-methylcytosine-specific restriction endonuclease McrA
MIKFCKKCQSETDRGAGDKCKPCVNARRRDWYAKNINSVKKTNAAYRVAMSEKLKLLAAQKYVANKAMILARNLVWKKANPSWLKENRKANAEKLNANRRALYAISSEKQKARGAAWRKANPEIRRIAHQNRRAQKRKNGGILSAGLPAKLFNLQKGKCPCCNKLLGDNFHLDHIMPIKLGGANTDDNMQLLRATCNLQKSASHPIDFMQKRGFLI